MKQSRIFAPLVGVLCAAPLVSSAWARADDQRRPAAAAPVPTPGLDVVVQILRDLRAETVEPRDALRRISALGPSLVPAVVALRCGSVAPSDVEGPLVDEQARVFLLDALRTWPSDRVVASLLQHLRDDPHLAAAMETTGLTLEIGGIRSSGRLFELLSELEPEIRSAPCFQARLEDALEGALRVDPGGVSVLRPYLAASNVEVLMPLARALACVQGNGPVSLWMDMLHRSRELDIEALKAMGTSDLRRLASYDDRRILAVREMLDSRDPATRRTAAIVLGQLGDIDSFELIIDQLMDPEPVVRRGALEALRTMSGLRMPADVGRWAAWHSARIEWLDAIAPELAVKARHGDSEEAFDAIRELASVPLFRRELSLFVSEGLDHRDPGVAAAACHGLLALGEPTSVVTMIDCLDDRREPVREAARTGLALMTGENLPSDSDLWLRWLNQ
ncbi:MAG: hypothetical protein GY711_33850 [bacterium]|nr:hypothetical protein [bacterium]